MGGAWRVNSNKTDKPWPAKYASKSKAEAAATGQTHKQTRKPKQDTTQNLNQT